MTRSRPLTALGRPLDPGVRTNLAVLVLLPLGGVVAWLLASSGWTTASPAGAGLTGAGAVLGGWAVGREVDPEDQGTAFAALAFTYPVAVFVAAGSLLPLFTALLLARVVNRTVGPPVTVLDLGVLLGLVLWTTRALGNPLVGLVAAVTLIVDGGLPGGLRRNWVAAGGALGVAVGEALFRAPAWGVPSPGVVIFSAAVAVLILISFRRDSLRTRGDFTEEVLDPARVRAGILMVLLLAGATLARGDQGAGAGSLLWAALAGCALWGGVRRLIALSASPR